MTAAERVLSEALAHGVRIYLKGDRLAYRAANGVPPELMAALAEHKSEILEYLQQQESLRAEAARKLPPLVPSARGGKLPLSYAQQRLWFIDRLEGGTPQYHLPSAQRVQGSLDVAALGRAFDTIVARHESLRTVFRELDGEVSQVILDPCAVPLPEVDLRGIEDEPSRERELRRVMSEEARSPFDLSRDLPLRVKRVILSGDEQVLLLTMHHIASDGWSIGVLRRELVALYDAYRAGAENSLPPLRVQYADYAQWQRQWLQGEVLERHLSYWRRQLAQLPAVHGLPLDRPRKPLQSLGGTRSLQRISPGLREKIEAACRAHGVTLFMFLEAVFAVLLGRSSQESDVVLGSPIAGRVHQDLEPLIGFFVNTLVLRNYVAGDEPFDAFLATTKRMILDAQTHQHVPFEMIVEELKPERSLSHAPVFQVLFAVQHNDADEGRLGDARVAQMAGGSATIAQFELELTAVERPDELLLYWTYRTELFDAATVERMAAHFEVLLQAIVERPDTRVADLPLLTGGERQELLEWSTTAPAVGGDRCLHELVIARAETQPNAVAIIDGTREVTYAELLTAANGVARHLQSLGVGPEQIVGVCVERNWEMVATLLGVLASGGAYLPLDPAHPEARLAQVLEGSRASLVVGHEHLLERLPWNGPVLVLSSRASSEGPGWEGREEDACRPAHPGPSLDARDDIGVTSKNLAYVLFTSGSTGTPKGVAVTHASAVELIEWARQVYSDEELAGVLAATSLSFDLSVFEIFVPLSWGGTVIVAANALALPALPARERVTLINTVPSAMTELVRAGSVPASVKTVNLAGEPLPRKLADEIWATGTVEALWNLYGPSEDTTYSTYAAVPRESATAPVIGRPIAGTRAYVVDQAGQLVPVGVAGELWLGGAGLARGYLHRPDLTAERFTRDPFSDVPEARVYRTGDLVRWLADGTLDFLGRRDHQVKVRGFRIELGEIESVLRGHAEVRDVVVVADESRLIAYVVANADVAELREHVRARLPEYMVPLFVAMEALPLTPNGKVDRRALPRPDAAAAQSTGYIAPRTELERQLCEIWQEVLGVERVGIGDNFFELGGHSLLATRLASRVRAVMGRELPLRALFEQPTIARLSESLPELGGTGVLPPIEVLANREKLPLSYAQQRLWFIDRLEGGTAQYNLPAAMRVEGPIDVDALRRAVEMIVARHESLRTVFGEADGEAVQVILDAPPVPVPVIDLREWNAPEREREVQRLAGEEARRQFDLRKDLPMRVTLVQLGADDHVLLLTMHHIASDGWSLGVLRKELAALYAAYQEGNEYPLEPLGVQYADYSHWQRQWLRGEVLESQLGYWRKQLADVPAVHALPLDRPRKALQGGEGARSVQRFDVELREQIAAACRAYGVTLFMFLEAAFAVLLSRTSQEQDVAVGSPIAGRVHQDLEPLIGFFVNTLVLRSQVQGDETFGAFLGRSRQTILDAYAHQHVPFEMLVEELRPERSLSHTPLFQILFGVQQVEDAEGRLGSARIAPVAADGGAIVKFELELTAIERPSELLLSWAWQKELFDEATIERMAAHFEVLLRAIVERPDTRVAELPLLTGSEREELLEWRSTGPAVGGDRCLHELVIARAAAQPEAVAIIDGTREVTYAELLTAANGVTRRLQSLGVGPEQIVGVCVERNWEMVATLLGVLAAGGAYLPLDPAHPEARLAQVLDGSRASLVVGHEHLLGRLPWEGPSLVLGPDVFRSGARPAPSGVTPKNLAYVLFTSGSTGTPKGVAVTHASAVELIEWARHVYSDEELAGVLAATSLSFDLSVFEIFVPLSWGGTVIVAANALALPALPARERVTLINTVPSAMTELVRAGSVPASVKTVNLAGEPLPRKLADEIWATGTVEALWNLYGPSEDTTYSTYAAVPRESATAPVIGRPITGTQAYVVDQAGQLVPVGVAGELWLGGAGLARGYLHRPDLTAERFTRDPFSSDPEARVYRTGDLVRWLPDGTLDFLGRRDHQVKVRGFRIELGEIESVLRGHAEVRDVVVVAEESRLIAYVVANAEVAELREHVRARLPEYMVPLFVAMEALPLTPNGKVDRRALPKPDAAAAQSTGYIAPRTELERQLCEIWQEVLGVERVGIGDNFFELGGHSLLATRLASRVRAVMGREVPLRALFEQPTIARLSESLPELGGTGVLPPIKVLANREKLPLSYAQQRLWFIDRLEEGTSQYNIPGALRVQGSLDVDALGRALDTIVARHESLRTVFREIDGEVSQVILDPCPVPLPATDLRGFEDREGELRRISAEEARQPFDLSRDLPLRVQRVILAEDDQALLLTMHHIASDGWSLGVLRQELTTLYEVYREGRENPFPPLRVQYADYAHWQRQWLQGEVLENQLSYWRDQLAALPAVHNLPLDRPRKALQGIEAESYVQRLDVELRNRIDAACREHGVTLFMFLEAAFAVLLSRTSQEQDVVVGSAIAGRVHQDLEPLIGFFVNTLVLRNGVEANNSFETFLASSKQMILDAYAHQHVPFEMLVEELRPERSLSHTPLFQILFAVQHADGGEGNANVTVAGGGAAVAKFELELTAIESPDELLLNWAYRSELFDAATIERMASHLEELLRAIVDRPDTRVAELPLLTGSEREELLEWSTTAPAVGGDRCLHELVIARATAQPEAVAIIDGTREVTYAELLAAANGVAAQLRKMGVGPEQIVGVCVERNWEMVATLLGVLASGGAYLPLDPAHPEARLAQVLEGSRASIVVGHGHLLERLPWNGPTLVLSSRASSEGPGWEGREEDACRPAHPGPSLDARDDSGVTSKNLAYVLFTSGSTGTPKGVAVTHASAVELIEWARHVYSDEELAGVLAATSLSFDLSVFEIFVPLSWGGTVIVAANALALPALPARERVTLVNTVPSAMTELVRAGSVPASVKTVNLAGEPLPRKLADEIWVTGTVEALWNLYGPSEDTTYSTYDAVERESELPPSIGRPIAGTRAYVVDDLGQPVPIGVVGELWLGGAGLARGYLHRPDLTAERFIRDPFSSDADARVYRTGDRVRWRADGRLEYLGRRDHQVKLRGFRIELGEIEAVLRGHADVRDVVVIIRDERIVAYIAGTADAAALREHVRGRLPEYMVPSAFVVMEALPLTPNGKVDRRALPEPDSTFAQSTQYVAPRTELERQLCEIWQEVLGVERVGIGDNFFELGGHSLLATRLASRVRAVMGRELPLRALFEQPTIAGLCAALPELGGTGTLPPIVPLVNREKLPLSYAQQRLWFIDRLESGTSQYNIPTALRVQGALDMAALGRAFDTIVARHESLRTVFREIDGEASQVILDPGPVPLPTIDLREVEHREQELGRISAEEARRPFDLSRDLPLRVQRVILAEDDQALLLTMHHIASDGWSIGVLRFELTTLYDAYREGKGNPLPPLRVQYADYAHWQRQWLQGEVLESQLSYWRGQLAALPAVHNLPLDRPRKALQDSRGARHVQRLTKEMRDRIDAACRAHGVTLFMFLEAAFAVLLSRSSGASDVVVGLPIAGRVHQDLEPLIGFFVNTLVLRNEIDANDSFDTFLASSKQTILDAYAHQHVPFEMLVEELKPERSLSHTPLFQILFSVEHDSGETGGANVTSLGSGVESAAVKFELQLTVIERADELVMLWSWRTGLFDAATIERMAAHFEVLLSAIVERPETRVAELPLLTGSEREQVLVEWNEAVAPLSTPEYLHELFEAQVERKGEAIAVVSGDVTLTYAELNARANQLAHELRELGVGPDRRVAICVERSPEMLVGVLAILKAGGAYVPLDPAYPFERLRFMIEDSAPVAVLTGRAQTALFADSGMPVVELGAEGSQQPRTNPGRGDLRPDQLAYILYTSGSTGTPKGVMIEHKSVCHLTAAFAAQVRLEPGERMLQFASFTFDVSVAEIFTALRCGATLVLRDDSWLESAHAFWALCERQQVNVLRLPMRFWQLLAAEEGVPVPACVRFVGCGGEAISPVAIAQWFRREGHRPALLNTYGPTEITVNASWQEVTADPSTWRSIGGPLPTTRIYVLDTLGQPVPVGVAGEICVGGVQVGRGYLNRPELTAEKFLDDPFAPGGRMYKTGDLGRWLPNGTIEFIGRNDFQVKVRGFRIELGEIEAVLRGHPEVRDVVVVADESRLIAYVVANADGTELREHVRARLPEYMGPSFVAMDALPLTPNGKVDRRALPQPDLAPEKDAYVAPRTELERQLCEIWQEVLGVERVGIGDNFFELGGHSLLATRLASRVRSVMGREVPLRALFEQPTIAGLCAALPELGGTGVLPPIVPLANREKLPLSYAQQRLWFIDRLEEGTSQYNIPGALRVQGSLDVDALGRALDTIVARHESLRTVFREIDGEVSQVILDPGPVPLPATDLREVEDREGELRRISAEEARRPFDLSRDLPLRVQRVILAEDDQALLLTMHHIASDGWSLGVLRQELTALYDAYREGKANPLAPLHVQYADYAHWQRQWLQGEVLETQLSYWRDQLAALPAVHNVPLDRPRKALQGIEAGSYVQRLDAELRNRIDAACRAHGVTLFMFLEAAFAVLLSRSSQERDVVVGSPIAGRVHQDLEPLIGFFVNTLVLRNDVEANDSFEAFLASSKQMILDAYAHQHVPFEMLVEELRPERSLSHTPLFQILFAVQHADGGAGNENVTAIGGGAAVAKFELELTAIERLDELLLNWAYRSELFDAATIERMASHLEVLLRAIVDRPDTRVAELPLLTASEREELLEWSTTAPAVGGDRCLHELVIARATAQPEAVAIIDGTREVTYAELLMAANGVAAQLREMGVGPEQIVGVCVERNWEMVATLLGVLASGGAYLPLDPAHPEARLAQVLEGSRASLVVGHEHLLERLPWEGPTLVLSSRASSEGPGWEGRQAWSSSPDSGVTPKNLAYVLFTSGSTGTPKGVAVTHGSAVELIEWARHVYSDEELAGVLAATSLSFDLSVFEIFVPLSWGGTVIVAANALALPALPARERVTLVNTVPSAMAELVRAGSVPPNVRTVNLAGEPLPRALADQIWATGTVEALWNLYGPSEDTTYSTYDAVERESELPPSIGRPIAGTRAYVVDDMGQPVPIGVVGELWLGGAGLARGYLHRPDLTAERFIRDPFSSDADARVYRTGDRVRWRADGRLEYLGRRDHQVKLRGFRIELGEIEAVLRGHADVRDVVAIIRDERIVAYIAGTADAAALREHVRGRLPEYMVPSAFVVMEALPLTPNGKVDRRALPEPDSTFAQSTQYVAPRTELERQLCEIWQEVLRVERVGIGDNFFELGGHSLLATRLASRVRSVMGRELPLRALFEQPTIAGLCAALPELGGTGVLPPIVPLTNREKLPLSYAQQRLWFIDRLEGGTSQYNIPTALHVQGALDVDALGRALDTIVARHESLRTVFREIDGEASQVILDPGPVPLPTIDLRGREDRESELGRISAEEARRPFDLSRDLPLRVQRVILAEDDQALLLTMHHIASDGWSLGVLRFELTTLYDAYREGKGNPLPPLRVQYADYAHWQRQWLQGEVLESQLSYWRGQLAALPAVHNLALDRPRKALQDTKGVRHVQRLTKEMRDRVDAACRAHGVTLFMFLEAAFAVLLSRSSGTSDVVVGSPIAGRVHQDLEPLIGFFVNTLVLRNGVEANDSFETFLASSKQMILDAYAHQHVPFEMLVEELKPERSLSHTPLFQILFSVEHDSGETGGANVTSLSSGVDAAAVKFELQLTVIERADELVMLWSWRTGLFDAATIERMAAHFEVLLSAIVERPEARVAELPLLTGSEREELVRWNAPSVLAAEESRCLHELFEAQVEQGGEAIAVVSGDVTLTYAELNARANQLAHELRGLGVGPDRRVAICVERSPEMLVGVLAILKAGGAYVPLDPAYPFDRLRFMIEDSEPAAVLAGRAQTALFADSGLPVIELGAGISHRPRTNPDRGDLRPDHLAYIIYTSGSTGTPKGVMIEHQSVCSLTAAFEAQVRLEPGERMLQFASFTFDVSVAEIFTALRCGATLVLRDDSWLESAHAFWDLCERQQVNVLRLPMRFWQLLAAEEGVPVPACVRFVGCGGEAISPVAIAQWFRREGHRPALLNTYGPTEITVNASWQEVTADPSTWRSIGGPLPTTRIYVLDALGQPVPAGVAGEICVGGVQVGRGYLNRPELTAEKFLNDPFAPGGRMYKTGDLGRWLPNGTVEFIGRNDFQVKVRGFRIELGEIESVLRGHPEVRDVVVVADESRLIAYVVANADGTELREHVRARLPEYMVPSFVAMDALPLTPNGKVDRRALPRPDPAPETDAYIAPRTELERQLCEIWQDVLGVERVGIGDNFFELGGHSLLATRLASRVRSVMGREVPLRALFEQPTIAGLCAALPELGGTGVLPPIVPLARREKLPLSYAQQRLWFIDRLEGGTSQYNIPGALRVQGSLDVDALGRALDTIVARHESLRTVFRELDGEVSQVILDPCPMALQATDLRGVEDREGELRRISAEEARRPFDLSRDLPLRVQRVILAEDDQALLLTMHHIASDGWSLGVLRQELTALYDTYREGKENPLPPLRVQYADYAHWQRQWLQGEVLETQLSYWRDQLAALPAVHNVPLDRPRKALQGIEAGRYVQRLDAELRNRIEATCREHGVTLFMFLEAVFAVLLSRTSQEQDVVVGSPIAGRVHQDLEPLIGFFVNTLVLRNGVEASDSFEAFLASSKRMILDAYAHQHVPFEMLVEELRPERSLSHTPLFQILFGVQHADGGEGNANVTVTGGGAAVAKFELELTAVERPDELLLSWAYRNELFDAATVERMAAHFEVLLQAIVERPDTRVAELPLLTAIEREELLEWSSTGPAVGGDRCLHELVIARAETQPEAVAVIDGTREVTYAELLTAANGVTRRLQSLGVGPEQVVGVCVERNWEMVATLLGVLAAGGAYLPLDPAHPEARLAQVLEGSRASLVVGHEHLLERLPWNGPVLVLSSRASSEGPGWEGRQAWSSSPAHPGPSLDARDDIGLSSGVTPKNLAYVLFTSGSTGTPKGVAVTHASAVELIEWARHVYSDEELAGVLAATSLSFDLSVFELFVPLSWGGTVILAANALALPALPARERVTLINTVPSAMTELVRAGSVPASVKTVNLAGEPLPRKLADEIWATGTVEALWNLYGPSEDTTYSTYAAVPRESATAPVIGRPITGTQAYVVDQAGQLVPVGVAGELWLGGAGLARGYLHRPDLTAERFTRDPFSADPEARVYRTGDLVRWLPDGTLDFLGRRDHQVKVRGFRIELGEIESVLRGHAEVRDVVVVADESRLIAYVVASAEVAELREHVRARLPEYMVPLFVAMEALPLTPNGKVDRRALPRPEGQVVSLTGYAFPRDVVELRLTSIWEDVLGRESVGIRDDFFELGGHSLLAVRLMARVQKEFGIQVPLAALFQGSTIETFAAHLRTGSPQPWSPLVPIRGEGTAAPLFCVHPIGGEVLGYRELARALSVERPVYALQASGIDGLSTPLESVETMAARYVAAIRGVQAAGPYFLAGWSFGGLIALEMARQLERDGESAGLLALIDSMPPGHDAYRNATPVSFGRDLAARAGIEPMRRAPELADLPADAVLASIVEEARAARLLPDDSAASTIKALFDVYLANGRAGASYRPAASLQRAVLLRASQSRAGEDVEAAWRRLVGPDLEIVPVPGDHYTMLQSPYVEKLAAELELRLRAGLPETAVPGGSRT